MKTNKLDHSIKEKLSQRTIQPSASAWERLSTKLDEQPRQKKRSWWFYTSAAASILLLITVGIPFFLNDDDFSTEKELVLEEVQIESFKNDVKIHSEDIPEEKAIVIVDEIKENPSFKNDVLKEKRFIQKASPSTNIKVNSAVLKESAIAMTQVEEKVDDEIESVSKKDAPSIINTLKPAIQHRIKVNADDLLYAVTHSSEEVKAYYASHQTSQEEVLAMIKSEIEKTSLTVDADMILAEVEKNITNTTFDNQFLKIIKKRITNIATAIASRND